MRTTSSYYFALLSENVTFENQKCACLPSIFYMGIVLFSVFVLLHMKVIGK